MTSSMTNSVSGRKPLRVWPGVVAVILQWLTRFGAPLVLAEGTVVAVLGGFIGAAVVLIWWLFFSRAAWLERLGALALMAAGMAAVFPLLDRSIATGAQGRLVFVLAAPVLSLALVAWAVATRNLANRTRHAALVVTMLAACGMWALLRTGGITGEFDNDLSWRWARTHEERLLAERTDATLPPPPPPIAAVTQKTPETNAQETKPQEAVAASATPVPTELTAKVFPDSAEETAADWPGFRGPNRDSVLRGVRIATDWSASPPKELWRRPIGPGWSSFAVQGSRIYTQEQRGEEEVVSCYDLTSGKPVWAHRDTARFWESNGGPGPRGTPTLSRGRVYALGATGIVNALNAADGSVVWSRNAASDTGAKLPGWGFTSSPLVWNDLVIVAASGRLIAYDHATGKPRWRAQAKRGGYSSPHLLTVGGVTQVLLVNGAGAISVAPADGKLLWEHAWDAGSAIVQPALASDGEVLMSTADMMGALGTRRIGIGRGPNGWTVEERWTSSGLKPYYNDFVVHAGHAFGFDGSILACIDLSDGKRKWKGGRYGHGQMVLLRDQNLLLVLSESGEVALVSAATDEFKELARMQAIEGKTWNHPVLVRDVLLVRNGEEMAAFRLGRE